MNYLNIYKSFIYNIYLTLKIFSREAPIISNQYFVYDIYQK